MSSSGQDNGKGAGRKGYQGPGLKVMGSSSYPSFLDIASLFSENP